MIEWTFYAELVHNLKENAFLLVIKIFQENILAYNFRSQIKILFVMDLLIFSIQ